MQGTPTSLRCQPSESHNLALQTVAHGILKQLVMNHIANCMRPDANRSSVYITLETSFNMSVSTRRLFKI
jgi:hypothetical protein